MLSISKTYKKFKYLVLFFIVSCSSGSSQNTETENQDSIVTNYPSHPMVWEYSAPESVGMNSSILDQAFDYAFKEGSFTQAAVVIKDGKLIYERYRGITDNEAETLASILNSSSNLYKDIYGNRNKESLITSWSTAKSFTSVLVGIAEENGHIDSIQSSASDYISEWSSDNRNTITIKNLLDMRSGLYPSCYDFLNNSLTECTNSSDSSSGGNIVFSDDQMTGCIDRNYAAEGIFHPWYNNGQQIYSKGDFVYSNCDTMVLGEIIFRATGQDIQTYAEYNLFSKIGIDASWWKDFTSDGQSNGNYLAYCCLDTTARDFAKFGYMLLLNGVWEGSNQKYESYVNKIKNITSYGLQFWTICAKPQSNDQCNEWIISTIGFDGQYIMIDFSRNLVVVRASLYQPIQNLSQEKKMKLVNSDISNSNWVATVPRGLGANLNTNFNPSQFFKLVTDSIN